jgi:hypothetical protein
MLHAMNLIGVVRLGELDGTAGAVVDGLEMGGWVVGGWVGGWEVEVVVMWVVGHPGFPVPVVRLLRLLGERRRRGR